MTDVRISRKKCVKICIIIFVMFKKLEERLNMLSRNRDDIKNIQTEANE